MRILLVRSHYVLPAFYLPRFINEPLGLEYLAAAVKKNHQVEIFDLIAQGWNRYWPADEKEEFFFQGGPLTSLQKKIEKFKPDVIGLTWLFSAQNRPLADTINFIKQNNKEIPLMVGGPHPSANPAEVLEQNPGVDIAVFGEGEITLKELLDKKLQNLETINGVAFRKQGRIMVNRPRDFVRNIDDIAKPAREMVPSAKYPRQMLYAFFISYFGRKGFKGKLQRQLAAFFSSTPFLEKPYYRFYNKRHQGDLQQPIADIMTSRGCPNNCIFCAIHNLWKHTWRPHSVGRVLEEIEELISKYKVKRINVHDDNFNLSKERIIKICQGIVKNKYNITFSAPGTYAMALDNQVLDWLWKAGFKNLRFSIESGNQEVLDKIVRKRIDLKKIPAIVKYAQKLGMVVEGAFIFGLSGETIQTMQDSVDFARKTGFDTIKKFIYQPFPNTKAYDICKEKGYLTKGYDPEKIYITGNESFVKTEDFSPEDVVRIARQLG